MPSVPRGKGCTRVELGLVNIVNKISSNWENTHPGLTNGIGKLKDVHVKLHIDESVRPAAITNRKIPFHMRPKIDDEEQRLLQEDTIEKVPVGEPTPWVSPYGYASTCVSPARQ